MIDRVPLSYPTTRRRVTDSANLAKCKGRREDGLDLEVIVGFVAFLRIR
jgi:hypothetical protein